MPDELTTIRDQSIQARATESDEGVNVLFWLARGGEIIAPWWSKQRDLDLSTYWPREDHVSGALYNMVSKMTAVPFHVEPLDMNIQAHTKQADEMTRRLYEQTEFGAGWDMGLSKFLIDLWTQDNGSFFEIIGEGQKDKPLMGLPLGIAHLDAYRCIRTRNAEYPVVYTDTDGKRYKLHYTRVIMLAQMPSPRVEMNGVGFCALSRMINCAQNLMDISRYKQEKLGSRPARQILIGNGITAKEIMGAFQAAEAQMDSVGLSRYSKTIAFGTKQGGTQISLDSVDMASIPDGFNEQEATTLGMYTIALALGVDARELWPATASGATKADAMLQHMKARGKGPGQIREQLTQQMNQKFLPQHLRFVFDFQDDDEDLMVADIKAKRADTRGARLEIGEIDVRTARQEALANGDLTESQFIDLELNDGRLENSDSVLTLFYSRDPEMAALLETGVSDPLDVEANNSEAMLAMIDNDIRLCSQVLAQSPSVYKQKQARKALAALKKLRNLYEVGGKKGASQAAEAEAMPEEETPTQEEPEKPEAPEEPAAGAEVKGLPDDFEDDLEDYYDGLLDLLDQERARNIGENDALRGAIEISTALLILAFLRGVNVPTQDLLSTEQAAALAEQLMHMRTAAQKLTADISRGRYDGDEGLRKLQNRLKLWENAVAAIYEQGKLYQPGVRLRWDMNPLKEHCRDCVALNGKVHTAETWRALGIYPKSHDLECGGWNCGCSWTETNEPLSVGAMPHFKERRKPVNLWEPGKVK